MTYRLAVDIGGTFTDLYVREPATGRTDSVKVPTTPDDYTEGFIDALRRGSEAFDRSLAGFLADTERLVHGTTIATNAILEGDTAPTALLTTAGFRDVLLFREGGKDDPYDWDVDYPEPYVPRSRIHGIPERVDAEGGVVEPLDEDAVRDVIAEIAASEVEAVAVSFLWAHVNPAHERRVAELLDELAPDLDYSLSHEVNPIIREYRRTISTAIDASLHGLIEGYFSRLRDRLRAAGFDGEPLIVTANGGVSTVEEVLRTPIWTVDAGPTMLPVAASRFADLELDADDVVALDMGGTSLDVGLVADGSVPRTREAEIGDDLLGIEKVDVRSIGSGGGSVAWVDEGGLLRVGPESAGADPGPACYGRGGDRPTVTDAALALGYLGEEWFLGGEMAISREAAVEALATHVGDPLDITPLEAARSVFATANQIMVNGIREVTVERGIDPRNHVLSGGGGALGVHAATLAEELRIDDVILPREAGVVSAVGGLLSDLRRDFAASHVTESTRFDREAVNDLLAALEADATAFLDRVDVPEDDRELQFHAEGRYPGQVWELAVPLSGARLDDAAETALVESFHRHHEATYGFRMDDQPVEFLHWRVDAAGVTDEPVAVATRDSTEANADDARHGTREAQFDGEDHVVDAYDAARLAPGLSMAGPALVDSATTTVVVPPTASLRVTDHGNYHLSLDD